MASVADVPILAPRPDRRARATDGLAFGLAACAVFLSPYNILRHPAVYFTAADLMTLLAFVALFGGRRLRVAPLGRLTPFWLVGFLAIAGGLAIGSVANQRLVVGLPVILQYAFAMLVLPWALGGRSAREARLLLLVWVVSMVIVALHGIYLMEFASDPPPNMVSGSGRLRGVLERETELGALTAMAVVATMYLSAERVLSLPATLLFAGVLIYGIILTASNTGLLAVASGLIPFTILQRSSRHFAAIGLLCAALAVAPHVGGDGLLPESFTKRVAGALTTGDLDQAGTFSDRMDLTREGWRVSEDYVLIGAGAEAFRTMSVHAQPVHNTYVLLLVEGGFLSMAGLCLILGAVALWGAILRLDGRAGNVGALVVAMAALYAVALNAFPHIYGRFYFVPLILVASLAAASPRGSQRGRTVIRTG